MYHPRVNPYPEVVSREETRDLIQYINKPDTKPIYAPLARRVGTPSTHRKLT